MKIFFFLLPLTIIACSCGQVATPTCDYFIQGVCVTADKPIDAERISETLSLLDAQLDYDLASELEDWGVTAHYSDIWLAQYPGVNYADTINMQWSEGCWAQSFVLVHEILHSIARHKLGASANDNHNHDIPGFFAVDVGDNSLESFMAEAIWDSCNR